MTVAKLVQSRNILGPRDENAVPLAKVALVNVDVLENAPFSIVKTVFGIVILVKPEPVNALSPIVETVLGIVKLVKDVQFWNIVEAIFVTRFPKVTLDKLVQSLNIPEPRDENAVLPLSKVALVNVDVLENAELPIVKTVFGIVILVKPVEVNAPLSIVETVLGIVKLVKELQSMNVFVVISVTRFPKVTLDKLLHD